MSDKNAKKSSIDAALFDKLKTPAPAAPVMQRIVEAKESTRENEEQIFIWMNKDLKKELKKLAVAEDSTIKDLLDEATRNLLENRGVNLNKIA